MDEAKELEEKSKGSNPTEYWSGFLGRGGFIYDAIEWYKDAMENGEKYELDELYDHVLAFCQEYYNSEWIDCSKVDLYNK